MSAETHIFIIWQNGRYLEQQIIADIASKFELLQIFEVSWPEREFHYNLAKFYGKSLPKGCRKEKECGCGDFLVLLVKDSAPDYKDGKNQNTVHLKLHYRREFGGKNFIHCSDTKQEGIDNLAYLTGMTAEEAASRYGSYNGRYIKLAFKPRRHLRLADKILESWIALYRSIFSSK